VSLDEAFLADICEHPDDDAPRLIYADWLDEHGQPERAEFIRVQIELARLPEDARQRPTLEVREAEILAEFETLLMEPLSEFLFPRQESTSRGTALPSRPDGSGEPSHRGLHLSEVSAEWISFSPRHEFRRGFVEFLQLESDMFVTRGSDIFARTPLREIWLPNQEEYDSLAACPHLARLSILNLSCARLSEEFRPSVLISSPYLSGLTGLYLCTGHEFGCLDRSGLVALATTPHLNRLRTLDLSSNWISDEGVEILARAHCLSGLEHLHLGQSDIGDAGVRMLAATPALLNLRSLDLEGNPIGEAGLRALLKSRYLKGLTTLNVSGLIEEEDVTPVYGATRRALRQRLGKGVRL
jgi:uncharacterized protein (TIGR02996 family)